MVLIYNTLREAFGCFVSDLSMNLRDSNSSKPKRTKTPFCMYACNLTLQAWQIYMKNGRIYAIPPTKKGKTRKPSLHIRSSYSYIPKLMPLMYS